MSYNHTAARDAGIEAWRRKQVGSFAVGDIVRPGNRPTYPSKYETLCYDSEYVVEAIDVSRAKTKHQLLKLSVHKKGRGHQSPLHDGYATSSYYDARNITLVRNGDESLETGTDVKKHAKWIIVDTITNKVVGAVPLTLLPENAQDDIDTTVAETAAAISRTANNPATETTAEIYTESLVDKKIADLLRKNPEGEYAAFKLNKTGRLPILPVQWSR